jgi:hypothetical protein
MASFGSNDFALWNRKKVEILHWFSKQGLKAALYLDGDIVLNRDPWPVFEDLWENGAPSLLFQCDCADANDHDGCETICSGVIAERYSSQHTLYEFYSDQWIAAERQDQPYISKRLKLLGIPYKTLHRKLFQNGYILSSGAWKDGDWVLLHYNYMVGVRKKLRMKQNGHWTIQY